MVGREWRERRAGGGGAVVKLDARITFDNHFDQDRVYLWLRMGRTVFRFWLPCARFWYWLADRA